MYIYFFLCLVICNTKFTNVFFLFFVFTYSFPSKFPQIDYLACIFSYPLQKKGKVTLINQPPIKLVFIDKSQLVASRVTQIMRNGPIYISQIGS